MTLHTRVQQPAAPVANPAHWVGQKDAYGLSAVRANPCVLESEVFAADTARGKKRHAAAQKNAAP
jgi:hypothetical protein